MSDSVTPKDGIMLAALAAAAGRPASEVARLANVTERTVRRWNRKPGFVALVNRLRNEMLSAALGQLLAANEQAVGALVSLLSSANESVKLGAASKVLSMTLTVRQQTELATKINELTRLVEEIQRGQSSSGQAVVNRPADSRDATASEHGDEVPGHDS